MVFNHKQRLSTQTIPEIVSPKACTHSPYTLLNGEYSNEKPLFKLPFVKARPDAHLWFFVYHSGSSCNGPIPFCSSTLIFKMGQGVESDMRPEKRADIQIWVESSHQYGISALVSQTSFRGETSGSVAKCRLFSQAI